MSDSFLKLIPSSPTYMPKEDSKQTAIESIEMFFPLADSVSFKQSSTPHFVDPGINLERINCPNCSSVIDELWWKEAMDEAYKNKFMNLSVVVPCCNSKTSLNELKYKWPAGFAQFGIEIVNPNRDISGGELHSLEIILDTKLRKIWAHY
jgi:hypothetical protein